MKGYNFKPKASEDKRIVKFLDMQDNFADVFRYLIEKEIAENGVRDLSLYIPRKRSIDNMRLQMGIDPSKFEVMESEILETESIIQKPSTRIVKRDVSNTPNVTSIDVENLKSKESQVKINEPETIKVEINNAKNNIDKVEQLKGQITVDDVIHTYNNAAIKKEIVVDNNIDDEMEEEIPECYF